jgi:carboxylesterase type B
MAPASIEERIRVTQNFSSKVDPNWKLDNFASAHELKINDSLEIKGFRSKHGALNYLGVPFGSIAARFLSAKLVELDQLNGTLDATLYGPRCPQGADLPHWLFENIFEKLGNTQRMSEIDCLNLNIYAPPDLSEKVPVFAYIHGGAFSMGDSGPENGM